MGFFGKKNKQNDVIIYSPINGKLKSLSKVKDEMFSKEMIGKGVAIEPTDGNVYCPLEVGFVKVAFVTGHAYGIESKKDNIEVLIHIGVDTVDLNGQGFTKKVEQDSKIKLGDKVCEFDLEFVDKKAKSSDVIIIVLNECLEGKKIEMIKDLTDVNVVKGEPLFKVVNE